MTQYMLSAVETPLYESLVWYAKNLVCVFDID